MQSMTAHEPLSQAAAKVAAEGATKLIQPELSWLQAPAALPLESGHAPRIQLARWMKSELRCPVELITDRTETAFTISLTLRTTQLHFRSGSRDIIKSVLPIHRAVIQGPTADRRVCTFRTPFHTFRVYIPHELIRECYESVYNRDAPQTLELFEPHLTSDRIIEDLTRSLIDVDDNGGVLGPTFVDAVGLAIATRMMGQSRALTPPNEKPTIPLAKWRLKRAIDYIESHLREQVYLADLSAAAGLSRMYFASQFRAATGYTPHAYILRRRVEDAQKLLLERARSISDVALEMGFSSQAHFTGTFKKIVGMSPGHWRAAALNN
jgi:AraC family transcriptional regulator